ncbi:hypothetical protein PNP85_10290 [Halobacterium salinarum]|uniref:hypothetical protein n=1 Tax=Halobacterium salinarum TaxID=2242 RepID=UPI002554D078|nr:hypothetical protein [Halobacterium salinarum]MDL0139892.1 hypothetical protein [Halobacterium salinarum]
MVERLVLLEEHGDRPLVAIAGVLEDVALVGELVYLVVQAFDHLSRVVVREGLASVFGGVLPVVSFGDADAEFVCREEALVAEPGEILVELWEHLAEELLGGEAVGLVERGITYTLGLAEIDISIDRRLFTTRPTQSDLVTVDSGDQNWVRSVPTPVRVRLPEELFRRPLAVVNNCNLQLARPSTCIILEIVAAPVIVPRPARP